MVRRGKLAFFAILGLTLGLIAAVRVLQGWVVFNVALPDRLRVDVRVDPPAQPTVRTIVLPPVEPVTPTAWPHTDPTVTPLPAGRADFDLAFVQLHFCGGAEARPYAAFRVTNTGEVPFTVKIARIDDLDGGASLYGPYTSAGFSGTADGCGPGGLSSLAPGQAAYTSYGLTLDPDDPDTARYRARATLELCSSLDPVRQVCATREVDFEFDR